MNSIFGIHEQALQVRSRRAQLLAANLANADTPNYKAKDLDWRAAMREGLKPDRRFQIEMARTDARHLAVPANRDDLSNWLRYRQPTQPSLDGNTVETHIEKAQFMENAIQYQTTLEFINGRIKGLRKALKGSDG